MKSILSSLVLFLSIYSLSGQSKSYGVYFTPFNAEGTSIFRSHLNTEGGPTQTTSTFTESGAILGPFIQYYYPLIKFNDAELSIGVQGIARGLIGINSSFGSSSLFSEFQIITSPALTFGSMSLGNESQYIYGASLDVGARFYTLYYDIGALDEPEVGSGISPNIRASLAYKSIILSFDFMLAKYSSIYKGNIKDIPRTTIKHPFGVGIGFEF